ncbi:hypothetical protein KIN20_031113 [Parelaphostrongylus tenuis]|uniref:Uncharacterized protein n=1 Tax=Parelaphostrongylus tenuis TaxID=148309 RepID=A0AAD5R532_PARTN|nr:hypothetical protein KIN20_031113 [Parelaphostrongylus tenuis]
MNESVIVQRRFTTKRQRNRPKGSYDRYECSKTTKGKTMKNLKVRASTTSF